MMEKRGIQKAVVQRWLRIEPDPLLVEEVAVALLARLDGGDLAGDVGGEGDERRLQVARLCTRTRTRTRAHAHTHAHHARTRAGSVVSS